MWLPTGNDVRCVCQPDSGRCAENVGRTVGLLLGEQTHQRAHMERTSRKTLRSAALVFNYPARIRTWTKRAKISCAAVTLPGKGSRLYAATVAILAARLFGVKGAFTSCGDGSASARLTRPTARPALDPTGRTRVRNRGLRRGRVPLRPGPVRRGTPWPAPLARGHPLP
jgi:hypothetical protein